MDIITDQKLNANRYFKHKIHTEDKQFSQLAIFYRTESVHFKLNFIQLASDSIRRWLKIYFYQARLIIISGLSLSRKRRNHPLCLVC